MGQWFLLSDAPRTPLSDDPVPQASAGRLTNPDVREPVWQPAGRLDNDPNGSNRLENINYPVKSPPASVLRWVERVGNYSPWNDVFSVQQQESALVVDVAFANRYLFLASVLGFSWVDGTRLRRVNPKPHPYWTWMRAARLGHAGVRYSGFKTVTSAGVSARYTHARFTIGFANFPMTFLEDSEVATAADEYKRNVVWAEQPASQFLAAEGGAATLAYSYPATMGVANDTAFRAPFGTVLSQIRYVASWKWVPYDYVFKGRIPANIYAALNKVNDAAVLGESQFVKGTMLFDGVKITRYPAPLRFAGGPSVLCDIDLAHLYFDPDRGITGGAGSEWRGHNLMPYRVDNKFYPAARRDAAGHFQVPTDTNQLFAYTDQTKIWQKPV